MNVHGDRDGKVHVQNQHRIDKAGEVELCQSVEDSKSKADW